ncbi:MAG TPA: iron-sulfur cluster assembly accessory protein [Chthonomonadaceae bacterium]|nr:iron-sulfur cluster assembly accessory protein [Chthonomonadaceae bacterium]
MSVVEESKTIVSLTPAAVERVKTLIAGQGNPKLGLRVGVRGGGCSGLSYKLSLEEHPTERDVVYEIEGLIVMVDQKSARFIAGTVIDYSLQNLLEGGWKFSNPNASRSCGCGTSFTPK